MFVCVYMYIWCVNKIKIINRSIKIYLNKKVMITNDTNIN